MKSFDITMYDKYRKIIDTSRELNDEMITSPDDNTLDAFTITFFNTIRDSSIKIAECHIRELSLGIGTERLKIEANKIYKSEFFNICADVIASTLIYIFSYPDAKGEKLCNFILLQDIETTVDMLNGDADFTELVLRYYIKYLVAKDKLLISERQESKLYRKYSALRNIYSYKGFTTINDAIREILMNVYLDYTNTHSSETMPVDIYDRLLNTNELDSYLKEAGIAIGNSKTVCYIKNQMIHILLADSYISMTLIELALEQFESDEVPSNAREQAISYIESLSDEITLPSDKTIRKEIYDNFIIYNQDSELIRARDLQSLDEEKHFTVMSLNPLCNIE